MANLKYSISKLIGKLTYLVLKVMPTGGKAYPGYLYLKNMGVENLNMLIKDQIRDGSILITGTNGKTTTTTMIIELFNRFYDITKSVDNNTIYALTTAILAKKSDIGIFEYGIRDIEHGQPQNVQSQVKPMGVIYTNISREHTQVLGVKKLFKDYVKAKNMLSEGMHGGIIITNADDPNTTYIGCERQKDENHVIYYGFDVDNITDESIGDVACPYCDKPLTYTHNFMNQRGKYSCECGFRRVEPDIKVTSVEITTTNMNIKIEGEVYNRTLDDKISVDVEYKLPLFGTYNIYNVLAATTAYAAFTSRVDQLKDDLESYFDSLSFSILPPGRFEVVELANKKVGIGQGDNEDALNANVNFMKQIINGNDFEFIYTTADENEEEIFKDHMHVIKNSKPTHISVMPGRVSTDAARKYYDEIEKTGLNCDFTSVEYDFEKRVDAIIDLIKKSEYEYVIVTGCGEEQVVWDEVKNRLKKQ